MVVEDVAQPVVAPNGVVIGVKVCGICGTDLHIYTSGMLVKPDQIMGHEFSAVVDQIGPNVSGFAAGDPVVVSWGLSHGKLPVELRAGHEDTRDGTPCRI